MRSVWILAWRDLRHALREKVTLVWIFLMPPIFFYFIGTVTGGMGSVMGGPSQLVLEAPAGSGFLTDQLALRLEEAGFDVVRWRGADEQDDGPAPSAGALRLSVPADLTDAVHEGRAATLILDAENSGLGAEFDVVRVKRAAYTTLADLLAAGDGPITVGHFQRLNAMPRVFSLEVRSAGQRREIPSGFEQSIPGNMVLFTLLVMLTSGAVLLVIERRRGLLLRLASAPLTRGQIVLGKWASRMILGLVQVAFAMLTGTVLFGMDWGPDLGMVVICLVAWAAFCASAGLLLGSVGQSEGQVTGLGLLVSMSLGALGGCMWPIEVSPDWMQSLQKALPSGWTMDALHRLVSFQAGASSALPHLAALVLAALVLGWAAARRFRFE